MKQYQFSNTNSKSDSISINSSKGSKVNEI